MNRPLHRLARRRVWMLPVLVVVLLVGHGIILYYMSSHVLLPAAVLLGVIMVLVIKHVGLLGPLYSRLRRRG
jgi:membrane protein YdbS with pleckstrin-like domain